MCLAIPGRIEKINDEAVETFRTAIVAFGEIKKEINISMVPEAKIDDYVLVHVGVAISLVDKEEAKKTFDLLKKMGEINDLDNES